MASNSRNTGRGGGRTQGDARRSGGQLPERARDAAPMDPELKAKIIFAVCMIIALVCLLILITNPIGSHMLAKGAYKSGIRPEKPMETDDLGRDFDE